MLQLWRTIGSRFRGGKSAAPENAHLPRATLPRRTGPRPRTQRLLPHTQLDQWPPVEIAVQLFERSLHLPHVLARESRMASPETRALSLPDEFAHGPTSAFIDDHEFCHMHPLPNGSLHLTLPVELSGAAVETGWAERHPSAQAGILPATLVMVYAPRNESELEVVWRLVSVSYAFAMGNTTEMPVAPPDSKEI